MGNLHGGTTIGGYIIATYKNFRRLLKVLTNITLSGDVSGSGNFDDNGNLTISVTVSQASNADTVDGSHASAFATSGHTHSYNDVGALADHETAVNSDKIDGHHLTVGITAPSSPATNDIWLDTSG